MSVFSDDDLMTCAFCGKKGCCLGCCEAAGWVKVLMPKTSNQKKPRKEVYACAHCRDGKDLI